MMSHAYARVPFYRETLDRLGLRPEDFRTAEDLARLPILERRDIQRDPERFLASGFRPEDCLELRSSGSSGMPLRVLHDRRAALLTVAHTERYRSVIAGLAGRRRRYRETIIMIPKSSSAKHRRFWMGATVFGLRWLPEKQALSVLDAPSVNIPLFSAFKPDVLLSYGSYLGALFAALEDRPGSVVLPKVVAYGADALSDQARRVIRERFGVEIASSYASVEAQRIGFECERHTGIHLNEDVYPLRVVGPEGRDLDPGEEGHVVVSNLVNRAMVLLNYRLGDWAARLPGSCPCGRSLPLLSFPRGRADEWLTGPDGRRIHGSAVNYLLRDEAEILQFQVVQPAAGRLKLNLVTGPRCDRAALERRLKKALGSLLGAAAAVDVSFVGDIPRTENGKARPFIGLDKEEA